MDVEGGEVGRVSNDEARGGHVVRGATPGELDHLLREIDGDKRPRPKLRHRSERGELLARPTARHDDRAVHTLHFDGGERLIGPGAETRDEVAVVAGRRLVPRATEQRRRRAGHWAWATIALRKAPTN